MDALMQYIMDYIRSHPDEYREWLKAKGQDEDGHEANLQDRAPILEGLAKGATWARARIEYRLEEEP